MVEITILKLLVVNTINVFFFGLSMMKIHVFVEIGNSEKYHQKPLDLDTISIPYLAKTQILSLSYIHQMLWSVKRTLRKLSVFRFFFSYIKPTKQNQQEQQNPNLFALLLLNYSNQEHFILILISFELNSFIWDLFPSGVDAGLQVAPSTAS